MLLKAINIKLTNEELEFCEKLKCKTYWDNRYVILDDICYDNICGLALGKICDEQGLNKVKILAKNRSEFKTTSLIDYDLLMYSDEDIICLISKLVTNYTKSIELKDNLTLLNDRNLCYNFSNSRSVRYMDFHHSFQCLIEEANLKISISDGFISSDAYGVLKCSSSIGSNYYGGLISPFGSVINIDLTSDLIKEELNHIGSNYAYYGYEFIVYIDRYNKHNFLIYKETPKDSKFQITNNIDLNKLLTLYKYNG